MNWKADRFIRLTLLLISAAALFGSFAVAGAELGRTERFLVLSLLALAFVAAGAPAIDLVQGYTKRRPLRLRWGKPRTELEPVVQGPNRKLPPDWRASSSLRPTRLIAGLAASTAAVLIFGVLGYAVAGSEWAYGRALFIYLLLALAVWSTVRFGVKALFRKNVVDVTPESATLGVGVGYGPALRIERSAVEGIEYEPEREVMAFVTADRRYEVSLSLLDNEFLTEQIAGVWPEVTWHPLSPDAIPTSLNLTEWNSS